MVRQSIQSIIKQIDMKKGLLVTSILNNISKVYQEGSGVHKSTQIALEKLTLNELDSLMVMILTSQR